MILLPEINVYDGAIHRQNLLLLNARINSTDATSFRLLTNGIIEDDDVVTWVPTQTTVPPAVVIRNTGKKQLLIICCGLQPANYGLISTLVDAWNCRDGQVGAYSVNPFRSLAIYLEGLVLDIPPTGFDQIRLIGHSWGGATMMWLVSMLPLYQSRNCEPEVYTYGAPKASKSSEVPRGRGVWYRRMCSEGDPVPTLPLGSADLNNVWLMVGVLTASRWNTWGHQCAAYSVIYTLQPDLTYVYSIVAGQRSPAGAQDVFLTLTRWAASTVGFGNVNHQLSAYSSAFQLVPTLDRTAARTHAPETRVSQPRVSVQQLTTQRAEVIASIGATNAANPAAAAASIQVGIPQVPGTRYRGITVQGEPWVYYGDTPVMPTKTRRTRRALVRYLNRQL